jgi:hypothetical protein
MFVDYMGKSPPWLHLRTPFRYVPSTSKPFFRYWRTKCRPRPRLAPTISTAGDIVMLLETQISRCINQRDKARGYVDRLLEKHSNVLDADEILVQDDEGNFIPLGEDDYWILERIARVPGHKFTHKYLYRCPVSSTRNLPLSISVYKLIPLLDLPRNDPRIMKALSK